MKQRIIIYAGAGLLVLTLLGMRFGCRGGGSLPPGDSFEARMEQIDIMRQRQFADDVPRLAELTTHESAQVRSAAVFALAEFAGDKASATLSSMLRPENDSQLRVVAAEALGRRGDDIPRLQQLAAEDSDPAVRAGALKGLVSFSSTEQPAALPTFVAALRDEDADARKWAIRGITAVSKKRFLYEPDKPPGPQSQRIAFIEQRMRELELLD